VREPSSSPDVGEVAFLMIRARTARSSVQQRDGGAEGGLSSPKCVSHRAARAVAGNPPPHVAAIDEEDEEDEITEG